VAVAAVGGLALVVGVAVVGRMVLRPAADPAAAPVPLGAALDPPQPATALVFVSGAVAQPGLYRLPAAGRVADAVAAAGGLSADADPGRLPDLAATVHDGRQVNVPFARAGGAPGTATTVSARVDVDSASVEELRAVPGMPLGLPEAIVDARALAGGFGTLSEMRTVLGVDSATFAVIRPYLRAGASTR
jgi:competence protein ComEA